MFNPLLSIICSLLDTLQAPASPRLVSVAAELAWGSDAGVGILMERCKRHTKPRSLFPFKACFKPCFLPWKRGFTRGGASGALRQVGNDTRLEKKIEKARICCTDVFVSLCLLISCSSPTIGVFSQGFSHQCWFCSIPGWFLPNNFFAGISIPSFHTQQG